jgi:aspartate aminotransferase-like enzyme
MSSDYEPRLFTPGPTDVFPEVRAVLAEPVLPHRGGEIRAVTQEVFDRLREAFRTRHETFVALASATGLMEAAVRNLVAERLLVVVCGAFSQRMYEVARRNAIPADALEVEWGRALRPEALRAALAKKRYDVVAIVHSETSTGILNPLAELAPIIREHDDLLFVSDVVSSLGGAPFFMDDWGVDLAFAGTQKAFALPPGLTMFAVSPRAMDRCAAQETRSFVYDFLEFRRRAEKGESPATINTPLVAALRFQLRRIATETMEGRWERHAHLAQLVRERLGDRFTMFPESEFATPTETVFRVPEGLDVDRLRQQLDEKGRLFAGGYGNLSTQTFRIGHMGDLQARHVESFLDDFENCLEALMP